MGDAIAVKKETLEHNESINSSSFDRKDEIINLADKVDYCPEDKLSSKCLRQKSKSRTLQETTPLSSQTVTNINLQNAFSETNHLNDKTDNKVNGDTNNISKENVPCAGNISENVLQPINSSNNISSHESNFTKTVQGGKRQRKTSSSRSQPNKILQYLTKYNTE